LIKIDYFGGAKMPMYEYQCEACGNNFELKQKFSDEPATECPQCGGAIKKLISQTAFTLKGSGWYAEGYSKGKESKAPSCPASGTCASCPSAS
jgi:putative FmdB family regulatory protein